MKELEAAVHRGVGHMIKVAVECLEIEVFGGRGDRCQRRMNYECVRCDQGARRCRGGGDSVDCDCGGRAAEDAPPLPCSPLFTLDRELVVKKGRLLCGPRLVGGGGAVLGRALSWENPRGKERAGGDYGKPLVVDGEHCADRLLLHVLETVNVLGDARVVGPPAERGREEGDNVGGLEDAAAAFETGEKVAEWYIVVKGGLLFE